MASKNKGDKKHFNIKSKNQEKNFDFALTAFLKVVI